MYTIVGESNRHLLTLADNLRYTVTTCLFGVPKAPPNGTVASHCNVDKVCRSLKAPLTADQLWPNPNTTWDYCTANDGAFMAPGLSSCIDCLQATEGEAYMSNCELTSPGPQYDEEEKMSRPVKLMKVSQFSPRSKQAAGRIPVTATFSR